MGFSLQSILSELGIEITIEILMDSTSAEVLGNRMGVGRTKPMQSRWLWVQARVEQEHLVLRHVSTHLNWADVLTKAVSRAILDRVCQEVGLILD